MPVLLSGLKRFIVSFYCRCHFYIRTEQEKHGMLYNNANDCMMLYNTGTLLFRFITKPKHAELKTTNKADHGPYDSSLVPILPCLLR